MATARLYFTASLEEQWQSVTGPWLREKAIQAWRNPKPTVVLTPGRAEGFYLRSRLLNEGGSFLGLRFWTPSDVRQFLLGELALGQETGSRAEQALLARVAAEKLLKKKNVADHATLTSVVQEPEAFLRAYDLLVGAGWSPARAGSAYGRPLAREVERLLKETGIALQSGIHRQLWERLSSRQEPPPLADLLMVGFNATHWPLWDLLRATVCAAEQATLVLAHPRFFGSDIDQLWTSSWEEMLGLSGEIPEGPMDAGVESAFAGLTKSYEQGVPGAASEANLTFLVTPELNSQAQAVVLQALEYLKDDSCSRLGIVFPEANALALEVASHLRRLGIPIDDGTGSIQPGLFEQRGWAAWIDLQQEPSIPRLVAWLRACDAGGLSCGLEDLKVRDAAGVLDKILAESLVDDLDYLTLYLEEHARGHRYGPVADFLRRRIVLPETASFSDFLAQTRQAMTSSGWERHLEKLQVDPPKWLLDSDWILSRRTFLAWLKESTDSRVSTRGVEGNHFYGKVHLLIYAQMTGQTWSHLILTGLNEGVWPRVFEAGAFGSRHELAALNQQARALNRASTTQGGQGIGHETVSAGHGHCLLPLERLDLSLRDVCSALEATSEAVCLTAMTTEAGRSLLPSDFFNHAYHARTGQVLDESLFRSLAAATLAWCRQHQSLFVSAKTDVSHEISSTRLAYDARHDPSQPFGRYEFAFSEPPASPIQLSCKTWEDAWNHPATVWLQRVVGLSTWPEGTLSWPQATGTWVHRWLTAALRICQEQNSVTDFVAQIEAAANRDADRTRSRAHAVGLELYPWWEQVWGQAASIARGLGETLGPLLPDKQFLSEYRLPEHILVALPGSGQADFALTGRIDLLLIEPGTTPVNLENGNFAGRTCWVIDFKTGSAQVLNNKKIEKGIGLQAVLYALAVRAIGAGPVAVSLHTFDTPLKPQVELDDALVMTPLFRSLDIFHRSGIFGMRPDAQNEYGFSPSYPIATRFVPGDILEAKWALVHGGGTVGEEEAE